MSTDRITHWTAPALAPTLENVLSSSTASVLHGSIATPAPHVVPFVISKGELAFPPVHHPPLAPPRRYTRRIGGVRHRPLFLYHASPLVFNLLWSAVLVLHLVCAVYLGATGGCYFYLLGTTLLGYLTLYGVSLNAFYLPPIGVGYFVVCGLHAYSVTTILFHSLRTRRSVFTSTQVLRRTVTTPVIKMRRLSLTALSSLEFRTQSVLDRLPSPFVRSCYRLWHALSKSYDATDIRDECFYAVFISRQILAMLLHVHQLYLASVFFPRPELTTVWAAMVVANCWSTPLLSLLSRSNQPRTRLLCVFIGLILDMTALVVIPCVASFRYLGDYDAALTNFPLTHWYDDMWFVRAINEFRMLLVVTPLDFVSKVGIALNAWRGLRVVPLLLVKAEEPADVVPEELTEPRHRPQNDRSQLSRIGLDQSQSSLQHMVAVATSRRWSYGVLRSVVLMAMGGAVLGLQLQLHAHAMLATANCALPIPTWFASKPSCLFLEYRCNHERQVGSMQELDEFLDRHDLAAASYLSIRNCSNVEMPESIRSLHNLLGIKVYKSTLARWDETAAATSLHHPNLRFVFLIDVQMAEFPRGLLSDDFPPTVADVEICRTNLTSLPDHLDRLWPPSMSLVLDEFPFTTFPVALSRLGPSSLSLAKSNISAIPPELFLGNALYFVVLNGNPISELPANATLGARVYWLAIHGTAIASVPAAYASIRVEASATPLCDSLLTSSASSLENVDCVTPLAPSEYTTYSLELEATLND